MPALTAYHVPCTTRCKANTILVVHACSDLQSELLSEMSMLVQHSLADWQACGGNQDLPDEHYQSTVLWAVSILLLNPWLDNDQTGRR